MDSDLRYCLIYNPQDFTEDDIEQVLAVWEGERDGDAWRWIVELNDGNFAYIYGSCGYTGWDCVSNAYSSVYSDPELAAAHEGVGEVSDALSDQVRRGKKETWREKTDKALGVDSENPASYINPDLDGAI
jgi:hypothetical protein